MVGIYKIENLINEAKSIKITKKKFHLEHLMLFGIISLGKELFNGTNYSKKYGRSFIFCLP